MSAVEWGLTLWSGAACLWWLIAWGLVGQRKSSPAPAADVSQLSLTVFKPLPGSGRPAERAALARALESFLSQLDAGDELLIGVSDHEFSHWRPLFDDWVRRFPTKVFNVISCLQPVQHANPKVSWLEVMAQQASRELWLWSDADIVAPDGLLMELKRTLQNSKVGAVTCPYCVRRVDSAAGVLDAAFINAEFLPGALLLGRLGNLTFSFGAATMFRARDFHSRVRWTELGSYLADDYALGQMLQPVFLASPIVEALSLENTPGGALRHYYRWQKTVRWCRPISYAALLAILPLLGWAVFVTVAPRDPVAWLGLLIQWSVEVSVITLLCRAVRCRMSPGGWCALFFWPPIRALVWLAVWLPLSVTWRGPEQRWPEPRTAGHSGAVE